MFPKILGFLEKRCKDTYKKSEKQEIWAWSGIYYGILWDFRVFGHKKTAAVHHHCCRSSSCDVLRFKKNVIVKLPQDSKPCIKHRH